MFYSCFRFLAEEINTLQSDPNQLITCLGFFLRFYEHLSKVWIGENTPTYKLMQNLSL